jgi:hypothetical protein
VAETSDIADSVFKELGKLLASCGLEEALAKAFSPSTRTDFVGVLHDTVAMTLEVTPERVVEISLLTQAWLRKKKCTLKELQSLLGKLHFIAACVRPGRICICRLLIFLRSFESMEGGASKHIPGQTKKDIFWWSKFLPLYNGVSMMAVENWSYPDSVFACDACLIGCGGVFESEFFHSVFPEFITAKNVHINGLELLTIIVCLKLWAPRLHGKRITVYCDNQTSVIVLNSGKSRDEFLQSCLREVCYLAAVHEFESRGRHILGRVNTLPDLLSRWHQGRVTQQDCCALLELGSYTESVIMDAFFEFTHQW